MINEAEKDLRQISMTAILSKTGLYNRVDYKTD